MKKRTLVMLFALALVVGLTAIPAQGMVAPPVEIGTRTLGFYVNHPCVIQQVLPVDGIDNVDDVIAIIKDRKTHASRLASQLMVTKLNVAVFGIGGCTLNELGLVGTETVNEIIAQAEALLANPEATKDDLSDMQDLLDEINNSNDEAPLPDDITSACPPGA
jgi:hypothetical protein